MGKLDLVYAVVLAIICLPLKAATDSRYFDKGIPAFPFRLENPEGRIVRLEDFKGKVVLVDFWYTGCSGCSYLYKQALAPAEGALRQKKDFVFLSVSVDRDRNKWIKSIDQGLYTSSSVVNVYTGGKGTMAHAFVSHHGIQTYPQLMIIDRDGLVYDILRKPYKMTAAELIELLEALLN